MELLPSLALMSSAISFLAHNDVWPTIVWITALTFILFIVAPSVFWAWNKLKKHNRKTRFFYYSIAAVAIIGATWSFLLPIALDSGFQKDDDGPVLRQILLYATGGLLGVITLGETHRKNNLEKNKNEQDHTRQVHAERRSRYAKAIEQLANEKAAIRLGGIYTLAGLADEWISDTSLDEETRRQEGQVIVNNLCAYIRSPFDLASKRSVLESTDSTEGYTGDFSADQAKLYEEQEVRRTIFNEISNHVSKFDEEYSIVPGKWSDLKFNFKKSTIFYPLDNLNFENADFRNSHFYGVANFFNSTFSGLTYFSNSIFSSIAIFSNSIFSRSNTNINLSETHKPETPDELNNFADATDRGLMSFFKGSIFMSDCEFENIVIPGIGERLTKHQVSWLNYNELRSISEKFNNLETNL